MLKDMSAIRNFQRMVRARISIDGKRYIWNPRPTKDCITSTALTCAGASYGMEKESFKNVWQKLRLGLDLDVHNDLNNTSKTAKNSHPPAERKVNSKRNFEKMSSGTTLLLGKI